MAEPVQIQAERTAHDCNLPVKRGADNWRHRPVGTVRVRGATPSHPRPYVTVKVSDDGPEAGRWRYLAIVVWEHAHGPLPPGYCLWHTNRNSLDCQIENLEAITLAERLRRNIANNIEACREAWTKQAKVNGKRYWRTALDARRLKQFKAAEAKAREIQPNVREDI